MLRFVFQLSAILKIAANMEATLKNKVDEDAPLISKILNTKNGVEIRCRLISKVFSPCHILITSITSKVLKHFKFFISGMSSLGS